MKDYSIPKTPEPAFKANVEVREFNFA